MIELKIDLLRGLCIEAPKMEIPTTKQASVFIDTDAAPVKFKGRMVKRHLLTCYKSASRVAIIKGFSDDPGAGKRLPRLVFVKGWIHGSPYYLFHVTRKGERGFYSERYATLEEAQGDFRLLLQEITGLDEYDSAQIVRLAPRPGC